MKGEVSKWFAEKGYGFVTADDGKSYFLHIKQISGEEMPDVGTQVKFNVVKTSKGEQAHNVVIIQ